MVTKFGSLTTQFKRDTLSLLLEDNITCKVALSKIPEDFFDSVPELNIIFTGLKDFYIKYNSKPVQHELENILSGMFKTLNTDPSTIQLVTNCLNSLYANKSYTASYIKDTLYEAITVHEISKALDQARDLLEQGEYDALTRNINKARSSVVESGPIIEFWEDAVDRVQRRKNKRFNAGIPTGLDSLDKIMGGGLPRGKLGLITASSGRGKSAILNSFAVHATLLQYSSVYTSYELDADDVMGRADACITGISLKELIVRPKATIKSLLSTYTASTPGEMFVNYKPTKTDNISGVKAFLERLRNERGLTPDVLFLDYFDLMKMEGDYTQKHEALQENMEILRGVAGEYNMAIWTASQTNRGGAGKDLVDMDDVSASFGKVFPLDIMLTVSRGPKEKKCGVYRLFVAKGRFCPTGDSVYFKADFSKMQLTSLKDAEVDSYGLDRKGGTQKSNMGSQADDESITYE
jgi:replicative DNA helicase